MPRRTRLSPQQLKYAHDAAKVLGQGGVVAFPTETVYGLGADATNARAVRKVFKLKGRPAQHPLIVHLAGAQALSDWAVDIPELAWRLAQAFWPGPLTLILRRSPKVPDVVTGGLQTVGLRVPSHPLALAMLTQFGGGVAAPSANRFGRVSATTAAHVREEFGEEVDLVLDGGACRVGIESSIVDLSSGKPALLRPGGVSREELERVAGCRVPLRQKTAVRSPGQYRSHYAPEARVILAAAGELHRCARILAAKHRSVAVVSQKAGRLPDNVIQVAPPKSQAHLARQLYALFRRLDRRGVNVILVSLPESRGLGLAIADRLRRAAGRG